jgi:hypothetical protein
MWRLLERCLRRLDVWRFQHSVKDALALHRRGEVRSDGLTLDNLCNHLEIRWRARDIHPWDRDRNLSSNQRQAAFAEQALADTEAAIVRLFERLPHFDAIELSVLEPVSEELIAAGTVHRSDLSARRPYLLSVGMRLGEMGVRYNFAAPERRPSATIHPAGELCTR